MNENREDAPPEYGLKNPHGLTEVELPENANGALRNPTSKPEPYRRCGAKRRNGQPCKAAAMPNGRCRCHGGLTPCGIASPHFKHGHRSKYLRDIPPALKAGYKAALKDETLHSLDDDLALLQARMSQLLRDLSASEAPPWGKVVDALVSYEQARRGKDKDKSKRCMAELAQAIRQGSDAAREHERIWADIFDTINLKSRAAAQEHRRQVDLAALVPASDALAVFVAMMERTKLVLEDRLDGQQARKVMSEIARSIHDLLPGPTATVIDS